MFPLSVYETRELDSAMGAYRLCYLPQLEPLDEQKPSGTHTNFPTSGSNWTVGKGVCCILPEKNLIPRHRSPYARTGSCPTCMPDLSLNRVSLTKGSFRQIGNSGQQLP